MIAASRPTIFGRAELEPASVVIVLPSLDDPLQLSRAIQAILGGEALAVVSKIDTEIAVKAAAVASAVAVADYRVAPGFCYQADATPLFEARSEDDVSRYLDNGSRYEQHFAARMRPLLTPAEIGERALAAAWPAGAERLLLQDRRAPFGVVRHLLPGACVSPHTDNSDLDRPENERFARAQTNLSMVTYLQPSIGGELVIYPKRLTTRNEIEALRLEGHPYALDRRRLPVPSVVLHPQVGTVVIFDAKYVHEVLPNLGDQPRVTVSGFALVTDTDEPINFYY